jgi:hypothetical protein
MKLRDSIHISIIMIYFINLSACTYAPKNTSVDNTYNARLMAIGGDSASEGLSSTTHEEEQYQEGEEPRETYNDQAEMSDVQFALSNAPKNHLMSTYVTLGSSKEEVARIQGTPTKIIDLEGVMSWWKYGSSKIEFNSKGRVNAWDNYGRNLKVKFTSVRL